MRYTPSASLRFERVLLRIRSSRNLWIHLGLCLALLGAPLLPAFAEGPGNSPSFDGLVEGQENSEAAGGHGILGQLPATDFASETLSSPAPLAPTQENSRAEAVAAGKRASKQAGDSVEEVAKTKVASKSEETPTWKKAAWIAGGVVVGVAAGLVVAPMAVSLVTGGLFVAGEWLVVGGVAGAIGGGLLGNYFSK